MVDVIAIFDIGKTNKKVLLFNQELKVVFQEEQFFEEIKDDDGFPCDDVEKIEKWMFDSIHNFNIENEFNIKAVNFATYGASQLYIDVNGKRLTPVYNYLKPMPPKILDDFYRNYGGVEEFSRKTASPASGMLNSGLQIIWLKNEKPEIFSKIHSILYFPQYLSYCFTGKIVSEYTYIGCHSSVWDFDKMNFHQWLSDYQIKLPDPVPNDTAFTVSIDQKNIKTGVGIHDSSASLVPYLTADKHPFVLMSTGTWCVCMNSFNDEPLTTEQLRNDALCFLSVQQKPVKSSRLFLGHIHHVNAKNIASFFGVEESFFKSLKFEDLKYIDQNSEKLFFKEGIPFNYLDENVELENFRSAQEAYRQLMVDLTKLAMDSLNLILSKNDTTKSIYISGGFARNEIFVRLIASWLPNKKVYTSEMDNSTALGSAVVVYEKAFGGIAPKADLELKEIVPY